MKNDQGSATLNEKQEEIIPIVSILLHTRSTLKDVVINHAMSITTVEK
jgi:hypothetical protein